MSIIINFRAITEPIKDTFTGEVIDNGYQLTIPFELFKEYKFNAKLKLYCPTCDFLKTSLMLHAWLITNSGKFVRKETQESSVHWFDSMSFKQPTAMYWPDIDQSVIEEFGYSVLLVMQPLVDSDIHEIHLELEAGV